MNCCNSFGMCDRNQDCPVREAAHTKAAERHFATDYGNPGYSHTMLPRRIRAWDWLFNLPHRFGRWVDRSAAAQKLCVAAGFVLAACLASVWVVPK